MPSRRSWIVPCHLGPFTSAEWATSIGFSMAPSVVIGCHVIVPLDARNCADRLVIVGGSISVENSPHWLGRSVVLVYSRRHHDITDENDAADAVMFGSWLASTGIELADWFVVTLRTVRSIPEDFGLPRRW